MSLIGLLVHDPELIRITPTLPHDFILLNLFQKAELLGFETHSAFVLDMRMAKNPERVKTFLCDLEKRLQVLKQQELDLFLTYKKEDVRI